MQWKDLNWAALAWRVPVIALLWIVLVWAVFVKAPNVIRHEQKAAASRAWNERYAAEQEQERQERERKAEQDRQHRERVRAELAEAARQGWPCGHSYFEEEFGPLPCAKIKKPANSVPIYGLIPLEDLRPEHAKGLNLLQQERQAPPAWTANSVPVNNLKPIDCTWDAVDGWKCK
jgi:hypothetical protein